MYMQNDASKCRFSPFLFDFLVRMPDLVPKEMFFSSKPKTKGTITSDLPNTTIKFLVCNKNHPKNISLYMQSSDSIRVHWCFHPN